MLFIHKLKHLNMQSDLTTSNVFIYMLVCFISRTMAILFFVLSVVLKFVNLDWYLLNCYILY